MALSERTFFGENFFLEGVGVERGGGEGDEWERIGRRTGKGERCCRLIAG